MKRIFMLMALGLMLAAAMALSGVAQAAQGGSKAEAQCRAEAVRTLQPGFKPSDYTFIGGTAGNDRLDNLGTDGPDVFCGFGGDDVIGTLAEGDIFLGGEGNDQVSENYGAFLGQEGDDSVGNNHGLVYGGEGNDQVSGNYGTFYGRAGDDSVGNNYGTFYGGSGEDVVSNNYGTFYGGEGNDSVDNNNGIFVQD